MNGPPVASGVIPVGARFALLAIRMNRASRGLRRSLPLAPQVQYSRDLPIKLSSDAASRFGSNRIAWLNYSKNYLLALSDPEIESSDTKALEASVYRHYLGMCIALPSISHDGASTLAGEIRQDGAFVQSWETWPLMNHILHNATPRLDEANLSEAALIADAIEQLDKSKSHDRLWRMLRAFRSALESHDIGFRVHC